MQFNQPIFSPTFPNNYGQYSPFHPPQPPTQNVPFPEVIGEGEVSSIFLPDGSVQFFFKPTNTIQTNSNPWNVDPRSTYPFSNNDGVWFIKKVFDPLPFAPSNQQYPNVDCNSLSRPDYRSDQLNKPLPSQGYQVKFHNDFETSTTDLHYFYPHTRQSVWFPKPCAEVQVELPSTLISSNKPCCAICSCKIKKRNASGSCSSMSVEDILKENKLSFCTAKSKTWNKKMKSEGQSTNQNQSSGCCSDKAVSTFTDQASGGPEKKKKKKKKKTKQTRKYLIFNSLSNILSRSSATPVDVSEYDCSTDSDGTCPSCAK